MEVEYTAGFTRDIRRTRSSELHRRVLRKIEEMEEASSLNEVTDVRMMRGEGQYYRVRIGDYRLGFTLEGNVVTLLRFLHRREIYRYFP